MKTKVKLTREFKKEATKAIFSILLFIFVYIILVALAVGLTAVCVYGGVSLVLFSPRLITILLGIGLASLGILVLVFLIKFIFKSHKADRSGLIEITKEEEPALFQMIRDVANQVETKFPKKVYLSTNVNAGVFYDHSFWSMFFPVQKNLQIGLGLINTVSPIELKAILAHEFGHFSQKTMAIGSYIYNVNQVIYNMLYENESYGEFIQVWANVSGFISIFVIIAVKIIQAIQWISRKIYGLINLSYMGLSREMEFHADEIAANVTGSTPLINSLLRADFAENSLKTVLKYYEDNHTKNIASCNVYQEQYFVMNFVAKENSISIKDGLPQISTEHLKRFNKSKLVIKDQWASHPSMEERVARLSTLNIPKDSENQVLPASLLSNRELTQKRLTEELFSGINYQKKVEINSFENFKCEFEKEQNDKSFDKRYNGYYDEKNPELIESDKLSDKDDLAQWEDLFSQEKVNLMHTMASLQTDIQILKQISEGDLDIKSFDYDGKKFDQTDSKEVLSQLNLELSKVNEDIQSNDIRAFHYFKQRDNLLGGEGKLSNLYSWYCDFDKKVNEHMEIYRQFVNEFQIIRTEDQAENLGNSFTKMKNAEEKLKSIIQDLLIDDCFQSDIDTEMRANFERYISLNLAYSQYRGIIDHNLDTLFTALNDFHDLVWKKNFSNKKELLNYQASLMI